MRICTISGFLLTAMFAATPVAAQQSTTGLRAMAKENDALVWQAVGRLDADRSGFCTATLISPELVLTAAHCVYSKKTGKMFKPEDLTFRAGLRNGATAAERTIVQIEAHPKYNPSGSITARNIRYDVALLRLKKPIPTSELSPFLVHENVVSKGPVSVVSYGRSRESLPSRQDVCQVEQTQKNVMFMDCNVTFGSSGAPVFSHRNGRGQIVSVISGMANIDGRKMALGMTLPSVVAELRHKMWANKAKPVARIKRVTVGSRGTGNSAKFVRPGGS